MIAGYYLERETMHGFSSSLRKEQLRSPGLHWESLVHVSCSRIGSAVRPVAVPPSSYMWHLLLPALEKTHSLLSVSEMTNC